MLATFSCKGFTNVFLELSKEFATWAAEPQGMFGSVAQEQPCLEVLGPPWKFQQQDDKELTCSSGRAKPVNSDNIQPPMQLPRL